MKKKAFLLGTVFPDIRYMGVLKREQTHFKQITLEKVAQASTPFQRGVLFHSFVDEFRDKLVRRSKIEKKLPEIPERFRDTFLKLVEDQILHSKHEWSQFRNFLTSIPEDELQYGLSTQTLTQWHTGLTLYFTAEPRIILAQFSLLDQGILSIDAATIQLWNTFLPKYASDPQIQSFVESLLTAFDQALQHQVKKQPL